MSAGPVGVAVVGAGVISAEYLRTLAGFPDVRLIGVADLDVGRAESAAAEHGVPLAGEPDKVLGVPEVEIVVNLTVPAAHAAVSMAALQAGKHVYVEKPLALEPADAEGVLREAGRRRLSVGCAPDTFLSPAVQAARSAIDRGSIGAPVAASAALLSPGPERWHPRPEFLFQRGAGPVFDLAPYTLTALVALLGPAAQVAATARRGPAERVIGSGPRAGTAFAVELPTHVSALIGLRAGICVGAAFGFDTAIRRTWLEIVGTDGTLSLPDPVFHAGSARIRGAADEDWRELPPAGAAVGRGVGVLEMARALRAGRPPRAAGAMGRHVLDVMAAIVQSAERRAFVRVGSDCPQPEPLPPAWDPCTATLS